MTQLDLLVLLCLIHINVDYLTMPLFFSAEIKAIDLALDHIEQSRDTDFIFLLIPADFFLILTKGNEKAETFAKSALNLDISDLKRPFTGI